jgi:hypothetical protein
VSYSNASICEKGAAKEVRRRIWEHSLAVGSGLYQRVGTLLELKPAVNKARAP